MPENSPPTPVDLSVFDNLDPLPSPTPELTTRPACVAQIPLIADERLMPQPRLGRLVEVAHLSPEDFAAASRSAETAH